MKKYCLLFCVIMQLLNPAFAQKEPLKIGVIGLTHTHVHWIFNSNSREEFEIVGIVEPNTAVAQQYADQYKIPKIMMFATMEEMIAATKPTAVTAFGNIYDHLKVVETCAPLGIHVMVEKPLAVSLEHAKKIQQLAKKHRIHVLTNYETTWYPTNHRAFDLVQQDTVIGAVRKIVVRDGHRGPKKIGVNPEFLEWLTDPVLNGGGATIDFGCYGANLATWIMGGQKPNSVTAVTAQLQPENNPKVEDEALIILSYDQAVAVIHGSWNWPIGRKDMEIYGLKGAIFADNRHDLRVRIAKGYDQFSEEKINLVERPTPYDDPFVYFAAVINGSIQMPQFDLSSLENNMIVMEILDAALKSAKTKRAIDLKK